MKPFVTVAACAAILWSYGAKAEGQQCPRPIGVHHLSVDDDKRQLYMLPAKCRTPKYMLTGISTEHFNVHDVMLDGVVTIRYIYFFDESYQGGGVGIVEEYTDGLLHDSVLARPSDIEAEIKAIESESPSQ